MDDQERLIVALEGRFSKYERDFERAIRRTDRNFQAIERRATQSAERMESTMAKAARGMGGALKSIGLGLVGGMAGGLAVGSLDQVIGRVGQIAEGVATIGDEARRAGIGLKSFQELRYVAEQNRIGVDSLTDGMKELNLRADEFIVTGKGSAAEAFQRLGFNATQLKAKLEDPSALLVEIIGRLEQFDRAARIRIADEIFGGTGGERFVELIDRGADSMRTMIDEANQLGIVMDEDVIKRAEEVDRKFKMIASTIGTELKEAVVGMATDWIDLADQLNEIDERNDRNINRRIAEIFRLVEAARGELADLQAMQGIMPGGLYDRDIADVQQRIENLTAEAGRLREILYGRSGGPDMSEVHRAGEDAEDATPKVEGLNDALNGTGSAAGNGLSGINSFTDAIRALKTEVPELAEELRRLDAQTRIDQIWRLSMAKARTMGDIEIANGLHRQASAALRNQDARAAADRGMLDLIGYAEGTDGRRGYNESLGFGAYTGGDRQLVVMTLDEIDALQTSMLRHPDNEFNSSALGRYQIVQQTLRGLRDTLGLSGDELFSADLQDRLAQQLLRQRGNDPAGLRNEWEGLRRVDDATIRSAYDRQSISMPVVDPVVARNAEIDRERAQAQIDDYAAIIASGREYVAAQELERSALSQTAVEASRLRIEHQMLAEAQRAGIPLSSQQRAEIGRLAGEMAVAEQATLRYADTQAEVAQVQRFFGQQAVDALGGLITGTMTAEQALRGLLTTLVKATLQAAILGEGPLAGLLGGGGDSSGGGFNPFKLIGSVLGLAGGGMVRGPGTSTSDSIPAMLSDGEFVVRSSQTQKHRALLEAINSGASIAGFAAGGGVGKATTFTSTSSTAAPTINISAPVTVNGSAGTPEQNADLARQMAKQMEGTMRGVVVDEIRAQMRPGNLMGR